MGPGTSFLRPLWGLSPSRKPSPGPHGLAWVLPTCLRCSSAITGWGLGTAQTTPHNVSVQILPVLLRRSEQAGPRLSCQHVTAPGHLWFLRATLATFWKAAWTFRGVGSSTRGYHHAHGLHHLLAPGRGRGLQPIFLRLRLLRLVLVQVSLAAHDDDRHLFAEVIHLQVPPVKVDVMGW